MDTMEHPIGRIIAIIIFCIVWVFFIVPEIIRIIGH